MEDLDFLEPASRKISLNIEDYSGPIDLLYNLIKVEGNFDITTFPLVMIADQYSSYMSQLDKIDTELTADFLKYATLLLALKARSLVNTGEEVDDSDEFYDDGFDEEELRANIIIHGIIKQNQEMLKAREIFGAYRREPVYSDDDALIVISKFDKKKLMKAFMNVLFKMDETKYAKELNKKVLVRDKFTLTDRIQYLASSILEKKLMRFSDLLNNNPTREELVTTFQALLNLEKNQLVNATQEDRNSDIDIKLKDGINPESINLSDYISVDEEKGDKK